MRLVSGKRWLTGWLLVVAFCLSLAQAQVPPPEGWVFISHNGPPVQWGYVLTSSFVIEGNWIYFWFNRMPPADKNGTIQVSPMEISPQRPDIYELYAIDCQKQTYAVARTVYRDASGAIIQDVQHDPMEWKPLKQFDDFNNLRVDYCPENPAPFDIHNVPRWGWVPSRFQPINSAPSY